jgi:hypothetical protein
VDLRITRLPEIVATRCHAYVLLCGATPCNVTQYALRCALDLARRVTGAQFGRSRRAIRRAAAIISGSIPDGAGAFPKITERT